MTLRFTLTAFGLAAVSNLIGGCADDDARAPLMRDAPSDSTDDIASVSGSRGPGGMARSSDPGAAGASNGGSSSGSGGSNAGTGGDANAGAPGLPGVTCRGFLGDNACRADEYCAFQPGQDCGANDASSTCKTRPAPADCTNEFSPVCGCNNVLYSNACEANAAGVGILSFGECDPTILSPDI